MGREFFVPAQIQLGVRLLWSFLLAFQDAQWRQSTTAAHHYQLLGQAVPGRTISWKTERRCRVARQMARWAAMEDNE